MSHDKVDARSFAFGELTAHRLRNQPELLDAARAQLTRCAPSVQDVLREWQTILDAGMDATLKVLTGLGERDVRLRQSVPFAGEVFISREDRNAILQRFAT